MFVKLVTTPAVAKIGWIPPLGIAQISGYLKSNNIEVKCIDFNPDYDFGRWISNEDLGIAPKHEAVNIFTSKWHNILEDWTNEVLSGNPDLVGISVLYHGMVVPSMALANCIKKHRLSTKIVLGGPFARNSNIDLIQELLDMNTIDGILEGEGEKAFQMVVEAVMNNASLSHIPGMWLLNDGIAKRVSEPVQLDPDQLPIADFSDFDLTKYQEGWHNSFPLLRSRGCVNRCSFCNSYKHVPKYMERSVQHIMREIHRDVSVYGVNRIAFTDNLINGNPGSFKKLCRAIISEGINIQFFGNLALLPSVDDEMLDLMAQAGFTDILLAVETPAEKVRIDMGKWPDVKVVNRIVKGTTDRKLNPFIYLMHSFPTERECDFDELLHFVDNIDPKDVMGVGFWPFRLAQVQPGKLDMDFVNRFRIELLDGYGYDHHNARLAFGKEPHWRTEWVDDDVKLRRHSVLTEYIDNWKGAGKTDLTEPATEFIEGNILRRAIKKIFNMQ